MNSVIFLLALLIPPDSTAIVVAAAGTKAACESLWKDFSDKSNKEFKPGTKHSCVAMDITKIYLDPTYNNPAYKADPKDRTQL
jgi:hypothetical protein